MSIPVNLLKYAGVWDASRRYYEFDCTTSPLTTEYFCCVVDTVLGGSDPSVQPSAVWTPFPLPPKPPTPFTPVFGSFSSTQTQPISAGFGLPLVYDTKDIASSTGINILVPDSNIILSTAGVYKVLTSIQADSTLGLQTLTAFLAINGNPVANTSTQVIVNLAQQSLITVEWFVQIAANDRIEVYLFDPVGGGQAVAFPPQAGTPTVPATPSVITTVLQIA